LEKDRFHRFLVGHVMLHLARRASIGKIDRLRIVRMLELQFAILAGVAAKFAAFTGAK
jgi:hypothetical protein